MPRARSRICTDVDPESPTTAYVVVAIPPDDDQLCAMLDSAYVGDGAGYLPANDVWAVRETRNDVFHIRIERGPPDDVRCLLETSCPKSDETPAVTTLVVCSDADWDEIVRALRAGEEWPVIIGPPSE